MRRRGHRGGREQRLRGPETRQRPVHREAHPFVQVDGERLLRPHRTVCLMYLFNRSFPVACRTGSRRSVRASSTSPRKRGTTIRLQSPVSVRRRPAARVRLGFRLSVFFPFVSVFMCVRRRRSQCHSCHPTNRVQRMCARNRLTRITNTDRAGVVICLTLRTVLVHTEVQYIDFDEIREQQRHNGQCEYIESTLPPTRHR